MNPDSVAPARLRPTEELQLLTTITSSFQAATTQADSKISMLLVIQPGAGMVAMAQAGRVVELVRAGGAIAAVLLALSGMFVACYLISGYHLLAALRPRTPATGAANVFAFPDIQRSGRQLGSFTAEQLRDQAWRLAEVLADIAMTKNLHIRRAIAWIAVLLVVIALLWSVPTVNSA